MTFAVLQEVTRSTAEGRFEVLGVGFADPWFLTVIPVAWWLLWRGREAASSPSARVPSLGPAPGAVKRGLASRLSAVPAMLRIAAVTLAIVALARPLEGRDQTSAETEGIDIALLLDRSSSMDERESPRARRRFDIVRDIVADFAERRMTDETGARDSVALFGFAGYSDLLVPFTLDVEALDRALEGVDVEVEKWLDGTAIGSAIAEATAVLRKSQADSRVIVLLTDGRETVGFIDPMQAARAAAELGIRVYTVFAGPREVRMRTLMGDVRTEKADVGDLPEIAEVTDGRFFHAESPEELEEAYAAIEALERTPRVEDRFTERYDLYPRLLLPALLGYALSWLASLLLARRVP